MRNEWTVRNALRGRSRIKREVCDGAIFRGKQKLIERFLVLLLHARGVERKNKSLCPRLSWFDQMPFWFDNDHHQKQRRSSEIQNLKLGYGKASLIFGNHGHRC